MPAILTLDPGFAWLGLGVVSLGKRPSQDTLLWMDLLRTEKSDKKLNVRSADDNFARGRLIANRLHQVVHKYKPIGIAFESQSFVRSASVNAQIGIAYGVLATVCELYSLSAVMVSPQEVKRTLGARSKPAIADEVQRRYASSHEVWEAFQGRYRRNKANHWHAWDAIAVFETAKDSEVIRALRLNA